MRLCSIVTLVLVSTLAAVVTEAPANAQDNAVIRGKVIFRGNPAQHKRTVLDTSKDPNCKKLVKKIGSQNVVLNKKSDPVTVRNVLVWIDAGLGDSTYPPPKEPVVLDQKGCQYRPHVLGVMEGQSVLIRNSDPTSHNIHFLPKINDEFNRSQPKQGMEDNLKLLAEAPFRVKCDVHPWMGCYIGVFKHPFFSVTGKDGSYELTGLPPGKYVVKAWHETFGQQTMEVQVSSGETKEAEFTYPLGP